MKKPHIFLTAICLCTAFILNTTCVRGAYKGLYSQGDSQNKGEIAIDFLKEGDSPQGFLFDCTLQGKKPLIIYRPTAYKVEAVEALAGELCTYNKPLILEIDCSNYADFKDFFRQAKATLAKVCPKVSLAFGIAETKSLWRYYPGDEYVDYIALNYKQKSTENALLYDPYELFNTMYIFGKSKPLIINLSVYTYSSRGHKYYTFQACKEIEHIKTISDSTPCVYALNYVERVDTSGNAALDISPRLKKAFWG